MPHGSLLVDLRPWPEWYAYHLRGSCPLGVIELAAWRDAPRSSIVLIDDDEVAPARVATIAGRLPWFRVQALSGGLCGFYKPGGAAVGFADERRRLVVDGLGKPVGANLGPIRALGSYLAPLGRHGAWRSLPTAAVAAATRENALLDARQEADAPLGAALRFDEVAGYAFPPRAGAEPAWLVLCDTPPSCLNAEGVAWQLHHEGRPVLGFVRSRASSAAIERAGNAPWQARDAFLLVAASCCGAALILIGARAAARLAAIRGWRRWLHDAAPVLALGAASPVLLLQERLAHDVTERLGSSLRELPQRGGEAWLALVLLVVVPGWVWIAEAPRRRPRWGLRAAVALAPLVWISDRFEPRWWGLWALAAAVLGMVLAHVVSERVELRRLLRAEGAWLPACRARAVDFAGAKTQWSAVAEASGARVPSGWIIATTLGAEPPTRTVEWLMCHGGAERWALRSSAPNEDLSGTPTPGRYDSAIRMEASDAGVAVERVLASYLAAGLPRGARVVLWLQPWINGEWAGVASREPRARGRRLARGGGGGRCCGDHLGLWCDAP